MPNQIVLEQIELAELTQSVDDGRAAGDPLKLPAAFRTVLDTRLDDLKTKDAATLLTEGSRATASGLARAALDQLRTLLRDGFNFIQGLGASRLTMRLGWVSSRATDGRAVWSGTSMMRGSNRWPIKRSRPPL